MSQMSELESSSICWLFVGSTGCGKSSLIDTLTDTKVAIGHGNESQTKNASVFKCNQDSNILLMDTVGFEDTAGLTFKQVLIETSNTLHSKGSPKIKVIWCVKPQDKSTPELQNQSKFINSLNENIWESVIICVKQATDNKLYQGPVGAAKEYSSIEIPLINIHGLDWIDATKSVSYKLIAMAKLEDRIMDEQYYLKTSEIPAVLMDKLSKIKYSNAIKFKKVFYHDSNECKLVEKKKHLGALNKEFIHEEKWTIEKNHSNKLTIEKYHSCGKRPVFGHSGKLMKKKRHKSEQKIEEKYHSEKYNTLSSFHPETKRVCPKCDSANVGSYTQKYASYTYTYFLNIEWNYEYYYYIRCEKCDKSIDVRNGFVRCDSCNGKRFCYDCSFCRCVSCRCKSTSAGCRNNSSWPCCDQKSKSAEGCKSRYLRVCGGDYYKSEGCLTESRFEHCNHLAFENGCVQTSEEFVCGGKEENGCDVKKYYECCGNGPGSECENISKEWYPCCESTNSNSVGCKDISKYSGCKHGNDTLECTIDYKYYSLCETKENETLNQPCGTGKFEYIPENYKS